jgi:hypothetical protein
MGCGISTTDSPTAVACPAKFPALTAASQSGTLHPFDQTVGGLPRFGVSEGNTPAHEVASDADDASAAPSSYGDPTPEPEPHQHDAWVHRLVARAHRRHGITSDPEQFAAQPVPPRPAALHRCATWVDSVSVATGINSVTSTPILSITSAVSWLKTPSADNHDHLPQFEDGTELAQLPAAQLRCSAAGMTPYLDAAATRVPVTAYFLQKVQAVDADARLGDSLGADM